MFRGELFVDVDLGTSGIEQWLGDTSLDRRFGDRVRYPAALPAAVALTNRISVHSAAAVDYFPHRRWRSCPSTAQSAKSPSLFGPMTIDRRSVDGN